MEKPSNIKSTSQRVPRCINIDWLELFCLEPITEIHDADYFRKQGYCVREREYGTRIYNQMFVVEDNFGEPFIEVRRAPNSSSVIGGLFAPNVCHLRLVNRQCYADGIIENLLRFCLIHGYEISRISRIDICLDFITFDSGDTPARFVERYIKGKYAKINQANIRAYGEDTFSARSWSSLSWGSLNSMVTTKLYNKTRELAENKDKPYIRQSWFAYGLTDIPNSCVKKQADGTYQEVDIWRLEFSIRSSVKSWFVIEENGNKGQYRSIRNTLDMYDRPDKLLAVFSSLCQHYFHFKYYEPEKKKSMLKDKQLFSFGTQSAFYKIEHPASALPKSHELASLLSKLQQFRLLHSDKETRAAVDTLIKAIQDEDLGRFCHNPFSRAEVLALQQAIAARQASSSASITSILSFIKEVTENGEPPF